MKLDEMVLRWDERRRPAATRWGSAPTPLTLGFVIFFAVAAPLAALVFPTDMEGESVHTPDAPVLCVRADRAVEQAEVLGDTNYGERTAVLRCRPYRDR